VGKVAAVTVVLLALSQWVIPAVGLIAVLVRLLLAAVFPLMLVPVGGLSKGDVRKGWRIIARRLRRRPPAEAAT
jgi:hypothetical protein